MLDKFDGLTPMLIVVKDLEMLPDDSSSTPLVPVSCGAPRNHPFPAFSATPFCPNIDLPHQNV